MSTFLFPPRPWASRRNWGLPALLDELAVSTLAPSWGPGWPTLNVWTSDDKIVLEAELPGVSQQDVELAIVDDVLTLSGERRDALEGATLHRSERPLGRFRRQVRLPFPVEQGEIVAELAQGVLTVTLPKAAAARPRVIPVKVAGS